MSTTPQDRVRASIALTRAAAFADVLLQCDKANPSFRLDRDLVDEHERAIWIEDVVAFLLDHERRLKRTVRLNALRSHGHALAENEQQTAEWQARQDVVKFGGHRFSSGDRQHYGRTPENVCLVCTEPIITNKATVWIGERLKADAHGQCCAKDDGRFELISQFAFRVKGDQR